jgi:hypothetical protein
MDARVKPAHDGRWFRDSQIPIRRRSPNNLAVCCLAEHANEDIVAPGAGWVFPEPKWHKSRSSEEGKTHVISVRYIKCDIEPPQNLLHCSSADLT